MIIRRRVSVVSRRRPINPSSFVKPTRPIHSFGFDRRKIKNMRASILHSLVQSKGKQKSSSSNGQKKRTHIGGGAVVVSGINREFSGEGEERQILGAEGNLLLGHHKRGLFLVEFRSVDYPHKNAGGRCLL
jgi:hypothetical protein